MNTRQAAAIDVFRDLGWVGTTAEQWPVLPIGTAEQRRIARDGLKSGDWMEYNREQRHFESPFPDDVDRAALLAFAIRCGIPARRAVRLRWFGSFDNDLLVALLTERGAKFAADYIDRESSGHDIAYVTMTPSRGDAWVQLVRDLELEPPCQLGYAVAWTTLALQACRGEGDPEPFTAEAEEHLSLAVEVHLPPHGALGDLLRLDLLPRERRLELCLAGLESAPRPSDRADWGCLLLDLAVTDDELRARADLLLGALASGEGPLLEGLGTRCVAVLGDEYLPDLLVIAGAARTKKAAKALLSALASRPRPAETTELESLLTDLLVRDADIAKATQRLCEAWGITPQAPEPETALLPWQPVPPTWQVPAFDPGPATAERLTELAAALGSFEDSLLAEQFVATLHAVVRRDPEEARLALAGVGDRYRLGLDVYAEWQRSLVRTSDNVADVRARDLGPRLAEVPAIVSLPSHDDLTIDPEDLLARLRQFDEAGIAVPAGDLYWALLRVDTSDITKDLISRARTIQAAVRFADGSVLTRGAHTPSGPGDQLTAGDALAQLLEHPLVDLWDDDRDHFIRADLAGQPGMAGWPAGMELCQGGAHYLLPGFPDFLIQAFYYPGGAESAVQTARCRRPLPCRAVVNLLSVAVHAEDRARAFQAAIDAWERGLLLPERFQPGALPDRLAAWATTVEDLAEAGMLALSWRVLDALLALAAASSRLPAGAKELVVAMSHLTDSVLAAVASGDAPAAALEQPGLRAVAGRSGGSEAVKLARELAGKLPSANTTVPAGTTIQLWRYEDVWRGDPRWEPVDDGLTVEVMEVSASDRSVMLDLIAGDGTRYVTVTDWAYCLRDERQHSCELAGTETKVWLWWDPEEKKLRVTGEREDKPRTDGPLSSGLTAVALASGYGPDGDYHLRDFLCDGALAPAAVASAVVPLLSQPRLATALLRGVEKNPRHCGVLWPIVTEAIAYAGAQDVPPRWTPRALALGLQIALVLQEAARRGKVAECPWTGLAELTKAKGVAGTRARELLAVVG